MKSEDRKKKMPHMEIVCVCVSVWRSTGGCDQSSQIGREFRADSLRF